MIASLGKACESMIPQAGEMAEYLMTGQGYIPCPISVILA